MTEGKKHAGQLVFGLDIGTRSVVGTVGYRTDSRFYVVAQRVKEHDTRAMLDGQIHDIHRVGATIRQVKEELEAVTGRSLTECCIAAAGRVLRTINITIDNDYGSDREVTQEDIYSLTAMGVEKAYEMLHEENDTDMKFYCVGHSVVHYYINRYPITNPEGHKAKVLTADMIATFLPDDVVDGLNKAVEVAGLNVVNMTLEPIAAIQVAIPEMYRMLNIGLVDVGAGTSDISITRDGTVIAFGMIPMAGDALTETIARHCLVDFVTAEQIKKDCSVQKEVVYKDIMGLEQKILSEDLFRLLEPVLKAMVSQVAEKIKELNGGKAVSAVFVVGGGGKITGYTDMLAEELGIQKERVAVRGEEVMQSIEFQEDVVKDSLLVTPVGICLSFYEQSNNFIFVEFNRQRLKLYDNKMLAVVDAAMQAEFPNDGLFPKRGKALNFTVNGKARIIRGEPGEAAVISVNGEKADIHTPIHRGDRIEVEPSTAGKEATMELGALGEFEDVIEVVVNHRRIQLPKFASVNGSLQSAYYEIQDGDVIELLNYYTVRQILEFMDISMESGMSVSVNHQEADLDTCVYENFSVTWSMEEGDKENSWETEEEYVPESRKEYAAVDSASALEEPEKLKQPEGMEEPEKLKQLKGMEEPEGRRDGSTEEEAVRRPEEPVTIVVMVNGSPVTMTGKPEYVYVDIFNYIDFDLSNPKGNAVVTNLNGRTAKYMESLKSGDVIDIHWT